MNKDFKNPESFNPTKQEVKEAARRLVSESMGTKDYRNGEENSLQAVKDYNEQLGATLDTLRTELASVIRYANKHNLTGRFGIRGQLAMVKIDQAVQWAIDAQNWLGYDVKLIKGYLLNMSYRSVDFYGMVEERMKGAYALANNVNMNFVSVEIYMAVWKLWESLNEALQLFRIEFRMSINEFSHGPIEEDLEGIA